MPAPFRPPEAFRAIPRRAGVIVRGPIRRAARDMARDVLVRPRMWTARWRALPSFLVIGARKGGTTSLFAFLMQHPAMRPPLWKESRFFDRNYTKGTAWYRAHFPLTRGHAPFITGEATASYLVDARVPARVAQCLPDIKLIAILRNPVDRAISDYHHACRRGGETRSMADALSPRIQENPYLTRGLYAPQVERYLAWFPPRQLLVLRSEDVFSDPASARRRLLDFLELEPRDDMTLGAHNVGSYESGPVDRRALRAYFRDSNERLTELVGGDFAEWD